MTTGAPRESPAEHVDPRESAFAAREAALLAREDALGAREDALGAREGRAAARDDAAKVARQTLARAMSDVDAFAAQLREANARLVVTTLGAQELAEQAAVARAAAEVDRDKLAVTEASLREASRLKDEFLAMLGHELRNPLAPILTALELMKMRIGGGWLREREIIERQVRHMVRLIDDLLDVSRIVSGKIALNRTRVEISTVVAQAVESVSPLLETQRNVLTLLVPARGLLVSGDPSRLAQTIANLLSNASKYSEAGSAITVTAIRDGAWVQITVADHGVGIPAELLPVVFDRFVRGHQISALGEGGLGLGLAIVTSMVELHGGTVTVHSEGPGKGSQFVVRLPWLDGAHAAVLPVAPGKDSTQASRRILVVDDNEDAAEMLAELLRANGHLVTVAYDGPDALREAARFAPDAVVLDIGLPGMDGYELARRLRASEARDESRARLLLIAVTGYGQDADRHRSAEAGFDVHLVKPVDLGALDAALASRAHRSDVAPALAPR